VPRRAYEEGQTRRGVALCPTRSVAPTRSPTSSRYPTRSVPTRSYLAMREVIRFRERQEVSTGLKIASIVVRIIMRRIVLGLFLID
jgi:hypothetical protein